MLRYPDRIFSSCMLAAAVLCMMLAGRARAAQPPTGGSGSLVGLEDLAAAPDAGQPQPGRPAATTAPANPPAFRPPLPGRLATDGDMLYAVNDPPASGIYQHPAGLFVLRFPGTWRMMRSISGEYVSYTFSTEAGRVPPKQIRAGVNLISVVQSDVFQRQHLTPLAILKHLLPGLQRDEPGMKLAADAAKARLGGLEAATCTLRGSRKDQPGEFVREYLVAEKEGVVFQLTGFAPASDFAVFRPVFLKIAADSSFGRTGRARREESLEARRIVERYKGSVVSILATNDQGGGTGSGFIISRDGYVITNFHVAFDLATKQPMKNFTVSWDESLKRPKVPAQLIDGKFRMSPFFHQWGTDVALLKIPPGDYDPLPLSPSAEVEAGDGIVTLGFPSRGMIEGISLTVTTGVVARFNRGPQGELVSIFMDAVTTHGSSGGPCVSLVTGGVIGLNTFGMPLQLDQQHAKLNDLINYNGVVPIDAAIREFPLVCTPGLNPQASGYDFFDCLELSKYFLSVGSFTGAEQLALRAVSVEPQQAIARMRLGECRFQAALDKETDGDHASAQAMMDAARKAYEEALARKPRQPAALAAFARLELQQNRLKEAAELAARAADADPEGWEGNLLLADICLRQSRYDDALGFVEKAKAVVGGLIVNPHMTAATIYAAKNDWEHARSEWAEAARISPVYLPARLGVAAYFEQVRQFDAAVAEYNRVLDDFPENGEVLGRIGLCLNSAGKTTDAVNYFAQSVERCKAAGQPPDESVLMTLGELLLQQPDAPGGKPVAAPFFALYVFHYPRGPWAGLAHLRLADIHARHGASGLASAHARLAVQSGNTAEITQQAQRFPAVPLPLSDIQAMLGMLQYPVPLAAEVVRSSPLGFPPPSNEQVQQLQQAGMPGEILQAIFDSLSQHPQVAGPPNGGIGLTPPGGVLPGGSGDVPPNGQFPGFAPGGVSPGGQFPGFAPPAATGGVDLRGTWVATGMTAQQVLFRSVIIFGDLGLFTSDTWVGMQSLGRMSGQYRLENGRLVLQPDGGQPFAPGFQMEGETLIMDVVNFAPGVRFTRQMNGGFPQ
jgi:tetratricopeptide (TPR) repeat protein